MKYREALFYNKLDNFQVECTLCPFNCQLKNNEKGKCGVRKNENGKLYSECYGNIAALGIDQLDARSIFHFYPGNNVLCVGTNGCNLKCVYCKNQHLSQNTNQVFYSRKLFPEELAELASRHNNIVGLTFTYNEPIIYYEFLKETTALTSKKGLKNVMITNGYINSKPLNELLPYIDAFRVDLKGSSSVFYREKVNESEIEPILRNVKLIYDAEKHLELSLLLVPGENDSASDFEKLIDWIATELDENVPLHLHRFFPNSYFENIPTPTETLKKFRGIARQKLNFVYVSNIGETEMANTTCPECSHINIDRSVAPSLSDGLTETGNCQNCGKSIILHRSLTLDINKGVQHSYSEQK